MLFFVFSILFISIGYIFSDDIYYNRIIKNNNLTSSFDVYKWTIRNYSGKSCIIVHSNVTPRHLMERHKRLWCDEGSIVMGNLDRKIGYNVRLVNLIGSDGKSHHTILEVYQNKKWDRFDFSFNLINAPYDKSTGGKFTFVKPDYKQYPQSRLYFFLVSKNYFIKLFALYLRGVKENDWVI